MMTSPLRPRYRQESGIAAAGRLAHRGRLTALHSRSPPRHTYGLFQTRPHGSPRSASPSRTGDRPVNSRPRPCLFSVGFPLSGLQDRTHTSDLNTRAQHTRSPYGLAALRTRARSATAVLSERYRLPSERCPSLQKSTHSVSTGRGAVHVEKRSSTYAPFLAGLSPRPQRTAKLAENARR